MFFGSSNGVVKTIRPKTVDEFFEIITPFTDHWSNEYSRWIFRGQKQASWEVLPSLLRRNYWDRRFGKESAPSWKMLITDEIQNLQKFIQYSDYVGLRIPGDCISIRDIANINKNIPSYLAEDTEIQPDKWPLKELLLPLALCQHSGIPTVLLDWTTNAFNAAYFACENAFDIDDDQVLLCLNRFQLEQIYSSFYEDKSRYGIYVIDPPRFDNTFLQAQSGLFTIQSYGCITLDDCAEPEPFEERILIIDELLEASSSFSDGKVCIDATRVERYDPLLIKVHIDPSFSEEIISKLKSIRVYTPSIYPNYYRIADYVQNNRV